MSLSNSLRAFLTVEWLHCSGGRSSSLGQLWREMGGGGGEEEEETGRRRRWMGMQRRGEESMSSYGEGTERRASCPDWISGKNDKITHTHTQTQRPQIQQHSNKVIQSDWKKVGRPADKR